MAVMTDASSPYDYTQAEGRFQEVWGLGMGIRLLISDVPRYPVL